MLDSLPFVLFSVGVGMMGAGLVELAVDALRRRPCITLRAFRVGGLRFLRVGRLQLSFCICRPAAPARAD